MLATGGIALQPPFARMPLENCTRPVSDSSLTGPCLLIGRCNHAVRDVPCGLVQFSKLSGRSRPKSPSQRNGARSTSLRTDGVAHTTTELVMNWSHEQKSEVWFKGQIIAG